MEDYKKSIEQFSQKIEPEIHAIWDVLLKFKNLGKDSDLKPSATEGLDFQFKLASILFRISKQHLFITRRLKYVNKNQRKIGHTLWLQQKSELSTLLNYINFLLVLVRSFGDSFVYIFYGNDREYLNVQLEANPHTLIIPQSVGGIGELEFVRKFKSLGGEFVIYHGITNILRIGDASLFSLEEKKVSAVVELKTGKKTEREIFLRATVIGHKSRNSRFQQRTKKLNSNPVVSDFKLPDDAQRRFEKQVKTMYESFNFLDKKENQENKKARIIYSSSKYELLKKLALDDLTDVCKYEQLNRGLIIGGFKFSGQTIFDRLTAQYPDKLINGEMLQDLITSILKSNFQNELIFGQIHFTQDMKIAPIVGSKPIFWEPIDVETLKKIYFGEIVYFTVYNVGWFLQAMHERGFKYEYSHEHKMKGFVGDYEGKKSFISGIEYFLKLITDHLQDESSVLEAIDLCYKEMKEGKKYGYAKIEIFLQ
jgi:hypothetical protein